MAPTALADADRTSILNENEKHYDPDHDSQAWVPAGAEAHNTEKASQQHLQKDDPATMAASEELSHASIEDRAATDEEKGGSTQAIEGPGRTKIANTGVQDNEMEDSVPKSCTPEADQIKSDIEDEEMRERLASPKKKRGRDQDDDEARDVEGEDAEDGSSADGSVLNGGRTSRLGPEKKRPRDASEDSVKGKEKKEKEETAVSETADVTKIVPAGTESPSKTAKPSQPIFGSSLIDPRQTSPTGFASSGFSALASSTTSPFGVIGASKPSIFATSTSGFGALAGSKLPPTSGLSTTLGNKPVGGFGFGGTTSALGFGGLAAGGSFGAPLGNGFAGGGGPKLSSFAAPPGKENVVLGAKPAKAFGAPESDEDDSNETEDSDGDENDEEDDGVKLSAEDKKKNKVNKVEDGEAGEATLLQIRAKLFVIEDKVAGWKERGVGALKINVPRSCATFDERGIAIPGSFDISGLEEDDDPNAPRVPRLIMRQENTHRVILNTPIVPAMTFEEKPSTSAMQLIFTAFETTGPTNMLLRVSEANGRLFKSEIDSIRHELI